MCFNPSPISTQHFSVPICFSLFVISWYIIMTEIYYNVVQEVTFLISFNRFKISKVWVGRVLISLYVIWCIHINGSIKTGRFFTHVVKRKLLTPLYLRAQKWQETADCKKIKVKYFNFHVQTRNACCLFHFSQIKTSVDLQLSVALDLFVEKGRLC
jgi:hypothetical protein